MKDKFYSFNRYLRGIFGVKVQRVSIDAGFTCPNLDGTLSGDGCVYCNNRAFSPGEKLGQKVEDQIVSSMDFYRRRLKVDKFIAYFQSFSGTYGELSRLREIYDKIRGFPSIVGLFISTRPDCIDEEKIKLISSYTKDYLVWIEYGLQTTNNAILARFNRGHTYEDFIRALDLTKKYGVNAGVHLILGVPGGIVQAVKDADTVANLDIDGIKFHVLHVLRGTALEKDFMEGNVDIMSADEYVKTFCGFVERVSPGVVISRVVSTAKKEYLVAPLWMNERPKVLSMINEEFKSRGTYQGALYRK